MRSYKEWCEVSPESMMRHEAEKIYGTGRGPVVCPKCGRTIKLGQGMGANWTVVPAHKKPKNN